MLTRSKRSKLATTQSGPRWLDLELGIWEKVFSQCKNCDLRHARESCSTFLTATNRAIKRIEIGTVFRGSSRQLPHYGFTPATPGYVESQVTYLPGGLKCLETVRFVHSHSHLLKIMPHLAKLTRLRELHIEGSDAILTYDMVDSMRTLHSLRALSLDGCNFHDKRALSLLGKLQKLDTMHITKCQPHGLDLMTAIAQLTGLTMLVLSKPFCFRDHGYSALASLSSLQKLQIGWSWRLGSGGESLEFLSGMTRLRCLSIAKCFVSDADLRWVSHLHHLEQLDICLCHNVSGSVFRGLGSLKKLREVNLEGSYMISDDGVHSLSSIATLEALNLGSSKKITTAAFAHLTELRRLRHLVVPQVLYTQLLSSVRADLMPCLKTYRCAPSWSGRIPGRIEEHFQELLRDETQVMMDPSISHRVLEWFQKPMYLQQGVSVFQH